MNSKDVTPIVAIKPEGRFQLLDLMRAGAALAVVLFHLIEGGHTPYLKSSSPFYANLAENGYLGVPIFFVLSGFVISHSLYRHQVDWAYVVRFVMKRSVRLDPAYWVAICVALVASYVSALTLSGKSLPTYSLPQIISHIIYLQDILGYPQISGVFWTLCMEFQFYIVYAILICLVSRVLRRRSQIGGCVAAAAIVSLLWPVGYGPAVPVGVFLPLWYGFLSGALCYWSWRHPGLAPVLAFFLVCLSIASWTHGDLFAATCVAVSGGIYVAAVNGQLARPIARPIMFLATISFSLYLIHNPVTGVSFRLSYRLLGHGPVSEYFALWIVMIINICAASIFWWMIERPCATLASRIGREQAGPVEQRLYNPWTVDGDDDMLKTSEPDVRLHAQGSATWDASESLLTWLRHELRAGMSTLETGAGRSTLAFAAAGCTHDVVTPSKYEIAAIEAEGVSRGIAMARVTFHQGFSQEVLPGMPDGETLDVAFIDGGHGFPIPAVDFQYIAPRLKVGGALLIDDVDLWTGDMIVQVLKRDPAWRLEAMLNGRTAVFRKLASYVAHEWTQQAYVRRKSLWPQTRRKLVNGLRLLAAGKVGVIAKKLTNERRLAQAARRDA